MEGEMGRGAQPWLGAEEQPAWTASSVREHLQLGWDFLLFWAAWLLLATFSCRILLLKLLSASQPCSLQPLLSFLFCSLWSWPNYPPPWGLKHLLPCVVFAVLDLQSLSLPLSNHTCNGCKHSLTLVFMCTDQPSGNNLLWPLLASELHLLKWEAGCVG